MKKYALKVNQIRAHEGTLLDCFKFLRRVFKKDATIAEAVRLGWQIVPA